MFLKQRVASLGLWRYTKYVWSHSSWHYSPRKIKNPAEYNQLNLPLHLFISLLSSLPPSILSFKMCLSLITHPHPVISQIQMIDQTIFHCVENIFPLNGTGPPSSVIKSVKTSLGFRVICCRAKLSYRKRAGMRSREEGQATSQWLVYSRYYSGN